MIAEWTIVFVTLLLLTLVSVLTSFINRNNSHTNYIVLRPLIIAVAPLLFVLSSYSGIFFTTFLEYGLNEIGVVFSIILIFTFGLGYLKNIAKIVRLQNIKSLPDLLVARYGKNPYLSIITSLLVLVVVIPTLAVQLVYMDFNLDVLVNFVNSNFVGLDRVETSDICNYILMATMVFIAYLAIQSTKSNDGTDGLIGTIALIAIIGTIFLIAAFLYMAYYQNDGVSDVMTSFLNQEGLDVIEKEFSIFQTIAVMCVAGFAFIFSPWQFHLIFVETTNPRELGTTRNLMLPLIVLIGTIFLFLSVATINNHLEFGNGDMSFSVIETLLELESVVIGSVLLLVINVALVLLMVIEILVVSTLISNDIVIPILLRTFQKDSLMATQSDKTILQVKNSVIIISLLISYMIYEQLPQAGYNADHLYAVGLILFQIAPATFAAVFWRKATSLGAVLGIITGLLLWFFTAAIPIAVDLGFISDRIIKEGLFGIGALCPIGLFGLDIDRNLHATIMSFGSNLTVFVLVSLFVRRSEEEQLHTKSFFDVQDNIDTRIEDTKGRQISVMDLQRMVGQYIGQDVAETRFRRFANKEGIKYAPKELASSKMLQFAEFQLAGVIGGSSARFILSLVFERRNVGPERTKKLLDEATELIHHNREILQSAIDNINQGICVLDEALEITCWNRAFQELLDISDEVLESNRSFERILEHCALSGQYGGGDIAELVGERILNYVIHKKSVVEEMQKTGLVLQVTSSAMPEGGCVITFDNVTQQVQAAKELEGVNVNLEKRVDARTEELQQLNDQLEKARAVAEEANIDKTRFLAAASHDISQPMNAARLYSTALLEKELPENVLPIAQNLDLSLTSVEEILVALLDISRLDSGVFKAEKTTFDLNELFEQLVIEFKPLAEKKGLEFKYVPTKAYIHSDRRHLRRILQNFISNAIKYTEKGRVLIGVRRRGGQIRIDICDTGHGVAPFQIKTIFKEFKRLENGMRMAQGVGLGLSIADRISKMIDAKLDIASEVDKGSRFSCFVDIGEKKEAKVMKKPKAMLNRNQLSHLNVICIDNEVEILDALKTLLTSWGVNGIYTETSKDALKIIEEEGIVPDAIIADYHLNFENGVFAIEKIRWQIDKSITAILATADRSEQVAKVCNNKDIILMHKPLKPAILRAILTRVDSN